MININLLPWREQRLLFSNRRFGASALVIAIFAATIGLGVNTYYSDLYQAELSDNQYLQQEINTVRLKLKKIERLQQNKDKLLEKRNIVESLQGNRAFAVRLFDEIVYAVPPGIYLENFNKDDNSIQLKGVSESNEEISKLLKNLGEFEWLDDVQLTEIITASDREVEEQLKVSNINFTIEAKVQDV